MKLTSKELEIFSSIRDTELGITLKAYLERLCSHLCDARTMTELTTEALKGRIEAAKTIENFVIVPLAFGDRKKDAPNNTEYM